MASALPSERALSQSAQAPVGSPRRDRATPAAVVRVGEVREQVDGPIEVGYGGPVVAPFEFDDAPVVVGVRQVRVQGDRAGEVRPGAVEVVELLLGLAPLVVARGEPG